MHEMKIARKNPYGNSPYCVIQDGERDLYAIVCDDQIIFRNMDRGRAIDLAAAFNKHIQNHKRAENT